MNKKRIFFGSDHAGFDLKNALINHININYSLEYEVQDLGCDNNESTDYSIYACSVARNMIKYQHNYNQEVNTFGVLCCGSGIGMSIAANRFKYIRAAVCHSAVSAELSRAHNNANVVCIGARMSSVNDAIEILDEFICTSFEGGRHIKRIQRFEEL